ncbi:TraM recognition domain-containing protein [Cellulosimicrobium sp. CUA-896]|uniref:TraM recognition domain-containing protein n=1 Tax=Cellulosimicrobium sp. CUA-896 TaxID=1517881 RepID=UPI0016511A7E|nr:TraM recognition domain-containing protein [Cellulosimicrobium sp. CUA-896]
MAILTADERAGSHGADGRLAPPATAVLDEVANVCRWRELPGLYSHYGSRGIVVSAFLGLHHPGQEIRPGPIDGIERRLLRQGRHREPLVTHASRAP